MISTVFFCRGFQTLSSETSTKHVGFGRGFWALLLPALVNTGPKAARTKVTCAEGLKRACTFQTPSVTKAWSWVLVAEGQCLVPLELIERMEKGRSCAEPELCQSPAACGELLLRVLELHSLNKRLCLIPVHEGRAPC